MRALRSVEFLVTLLFLATVSVHGQRMAFTSFSDGSGQSHFGFLDSKQVVHHAYYDGTNWINGSEGNVAAYGSALSGFPFGAQEQHIAYLDQSNIVHQTYYLPGLPWQDQNLASVAAPGSALTTFIFGGNEQHIAYLDQSNVVHQLYYVYGSTWRDENLNSVAAPGSSLTSFVFRGNEEHIGYLDQNNVVHQLYYIYGSTWRDENLNSVAAPGSSLTSFVVGDQETHIVYLDQNSVVHQVFYTYGSVWADQNLGTLAASGSALTSFVVGAQEQHIAYLDPSYSVHELYYSSNGWVDQNLGGNASPSSPLSGFVDENNKQHIFYLASNGDIHDLVYDPRSNGRIDQNISFPPNWTRAVSASGVDANGIPIGYSYDPSIIESNGLYYMHFCSEDPAARFDGIRITTSTDGVNWTQPRFALRVSDTNGERSACDPTVVSFNAGDGQYYYMVYSGIDSPYNDTAMYIARSTSPLGPFQKYSASAGWQTDSPSPSIIVAPQNRGTGTYGAGSSKLIVHDGLLYMLYDDTSVDGQDHLFLTTSSNGINWSTPQDTHLHMPPGGFRYDSNAGQFILLEGTQEYTSVDGVNWSAPRTISLDRILGSGGAALLGDDQGSIIWNANRVFIWTGDIQSIWGSPISLLP